MASEGARQVADERVSLSVKEVIGEDGPLAEVFLLPLVTDWRVPRQCVYSLTGDACDRLLAVLYVLDEPLCGFGGGPDGFKVVGACREHDRLLRAREGKEESGGE